MSPVVGSRKRFIAMLFLFVISIIIECIPQEAEARGRAFGRRGGGGRRVNQARGRKRNNGGQRRVVRNNNNNDIFGLDQEPVNVFSSLQLDPFGTIQQLNGFNNIFTNGQGRFFTGNIGLNGGLNNIALQAELLRNASGSGFFGATSLSTGAFNPSIPTETFNQIQFLNTLGTLGTSCRFGRCDLR